MTMRASIKPMQLRQWTMTGFGKADFPQGWKQALRSVMFLPVAKPEAAGLGCITLAHSMFRRVAVEGVLDQLTMPPNCAW